MTIIVVLAQNPVRALFFLLAPVCRCCSEVAPSLESFPQQYLRGLLSSAMMAANSHSDPAVSSIEDVFDKRDKHRNDQQHYDDEQQGCSAHAPRHLVFHCELMSVDPLWRISHAESRKH